MQRQLSAVIQHEAEGNGCGVVEWEEREWGILMKLRNLKPLKAPCVR